MAFARTGIDEFPLNRDGLSATWIAKCLQRAKVPGPGPSRIAIEELDELGQTADAYVVHLDFDEEPDPACPRSLFAKTAPLDDGHRLQIHDLGLYARELSFYHDFGTDPGIPIPNVYFANLNPDTGHFYLLLENLFEHCRQGDMWRANVADVETCIDHLARFHAHWWQHARVLTSRWLSPNDALSHFEREVVPMLGTLSSLCKRKYGNAYTDYLRYVVEHLDRGWARAWTTDPIAETTLLHGDFHPKELFFQEVDGAPRVIASDWQATCLGSPGVDLHRILLAGLSGEQIVEHQERLLARYHTAVSEQGVKIDEAALSADTRRSMLLAIRNWLFSVAFTDNDMLERSASAVGVDYLDRIFRGFSDALEWNRVHELMES